MTPRPQDAALATLAPKINRLTARLDWSQDAAGLARRVRAFDPEPGAWAVLDGEEIKLFGGRAASGAGVPGTVLAAGDALVIAADVGAPEVSELQPAGRRRMSAAEWSRATDAAGARFT
jgi:methionyl-tRNA formyltransferase